MICEKCGKENSESSAYCTGCGSLLAPPEDNGEGIKSHMTAAVLTTVLLGSWALGIPAIVFARECERACAEGNFALAKRFSKRALTFTCIGGALSAAIGALGIMAAVILTNNVII